MHENDPFFILEDAGGDASPATLTTPTDAAVDLYVILSRPSAESNFGGTSVENASPSCAVQTKDVANLTITNNGTTSLQISDLLVNEEGEIVTNESGEALYASGQYQYTIKRKHTDVDGITIFELTQN